VDLRIISIGTLSAHPLRGERSPVRTGHATTTLIRLGEARILVDPSLPAQALVARLEERSGLAPKDITHVFLTSFNPELRRALPAFAEAAWLINEPERETIGRALVAKFHEASEEGDAAMRDALEQDLAILKRCQPAPDTLATHKGQRVDLFPLPGLTPGLAGLLIPDRRHTTLICGDAVPTTEHLEQGQVLMGAADVDQARASFGEAIEIADLLVLGRDNIVPNPTKRPF